MKPLAILPTVILPVFVTGVFALLTSCGGGSGNEGKEGKENGWESADSTAATFDTLANKGIGPVQSLSLGAIDPALAEKGKTIFTTKCASCHKFDQKYVGPPLYGVTKRRAPEWIMNQMLNPDKMIKEDPIAKALFAKYLVPMTFQNVSQDDARALLEYLRETDSK